MSTPIPRWRGFNITDLFSTSSRWKEFFPIDDGHVAEQDFEMIRELGFNFVRIPMSYFFFGKGAYARTPDPDRLVLLDRAVELGQKYGIHVMPGFHRAPGYCVTAGSQFDTPEKGNLFGEGEDLQDFLVWWRTLAERYADVPREDLSFNLVNEPFNIPDDLFERTFTPVIEAIEKISPQRLIQVEGSFAIEGAGSGVVDLNDPGEMSGTTIALRPAPASIATRDNVVNSVHLYHPFALTHYECPWAESLVSDEFEPPTWPYQATLKPGVDRKLTGEDAKRWDKEALRDLLKGYLDLSAAGYKVHVGEMGAYSKVAHDVYLDYARDVVSLLDQYGLGFAMWNFRGPFGVMDTGRTDAPAEEFHGHQLDRELADVLLGA